MHLALTDLFRAKWTEQIHEEWKRSLLASRPDLTRAQLDRTQRLMDSKVRDCLVSEHESLISAISLPDAKDRHVVAAAIVANATTIVTFNLKDFPAAELGKYGVEAQHPDDFVLHQIDLSPPLVCLAAKRQRASLKKPSKTVDEFLTTLQRQGLPQSVERLREFAELL